jgi:hypothetical protein
MIRGLLLGVLVAVMGGTAAWADAGTGAWAEKTYKASMKAGAPYPGLVDFDNRCFPTGKNPFQIQNQSPVPEDKAYHAGAWNAPCRQITGAELLAILKAVPADGSINLAGVEVLADDGSDRIDDLSGQILPVRLRFDRASFDKRLYLNDAHLASLTIRNTQFRGPLNAGGLVTDANLTITNIFVAELTDIRSMNVGGDMMLSALYSPYTLYADNEKVTGSFYLQHALQAPGVELSNSTFGRSLHFIGMAAAGDVICRSCEIGADLDFEAASTMDMHGASQFKQNVDVSFSHVGGDVNVEQAVIAGVFSLDSAALDNLRFDTGTSVRSLSARAAVIGGNVSTAAGGKISFGTVALNDTTIAKQLDLSGLDASSWTSNQTDTPSLDLTNTSVDSFTDCKAAWPKRIRIDGFKYNSAEKPYGMNCTLIDDDASKQTDTGWLDWLDLNNGASDQPVFDPGPYIFLAKYFDGVGQKSWSDDILYQAKVNEQIDAWRHGEAARFVGLFVLHWMAGFGIGVHAFYHLLWVILFSILAGLGVLRLSPAARPHGVWWRTGACLEKLLPIIELRAEFRDFFDRSDGETPGGANGLTNFQKGFFVVYALWGWFVGTLFVAVFSGLTQGN